MQIKRSFVRPEPDPLTLALSRLGAIATSVCNDMAPSLFCLSVQTRIIFHEKGEVE